MIPVRPFLGFFRRFRHKLICQMDKAYLRNLTEEDKFEITFQYVDPEVRVNRQFNSSRQSSEPISAFLNRLAANIEKEIKKKTKSQSEAPIQVSLTQDSKPVDENALCKDVFTENANLNLQIQRNSYEVIVNSPWINSLALPKSILANFLVYPTKFQAVNTDRNISQFRWFASPDKKTWSPVGEGFVYNVGNSDIDSYLKLNCVPRKGALEGPETDVVSTVKVGASPGQCPFELRHLHTQERCEGDTFRVVSYNILADLYCDSDYTREVLHPYCPAYALHIDYRKQLIIKELLGFNSDIICLQEVDRKVYNYDLKNLFLQLGYDSDYCQKRGDVAEGVACFYNNKRFKNLESQRVIPGDELKTNPLFGEIWERVSLNEQLSERILNRSTVLQVNILEALDRDEILVVGNTHLYFHPDADHIRLLQGAIIIRYLENLINELKEKFSKRVSLVLCGDFNSVPECGIYQLFTTGSIENEHIDFRSNVDQAVEGLALAQSFLLRSACGTPKYTNFTAGFADCLDYIYYEDSSFTVSQSVPLPTVEELNRNTALPSVVFPSDHVSLIADLKWRSFLISFKSTMGPLV